MRKHSTAPPISTKPDAATDAAQARRLAHGIALAAVLTTGIVAFIVIGIAMWQDASNETITMLAIGAGVALVLSYVVIFALALTGLTVSAIIATYPFLVGFWAWLFGRKRQQDKSQKRVIFIQGNPVAFDPEDDDAVIDGLGWPLAKVRQALLWAETHGLAESAWKNGPLTDPELRQFRAWLSRNGYAGKAGDNRNAPWTLTGSVNDILKKVDEWLS